MTRYRRGVRARVALIAVIAACGADEPSAADEQRARADRARAKAAVRCDQGDGPSCFVAAVGLDYTNKAQLERAMWAWERGCGLGHGPSCAQMGTAAEHGMIGDGSKWSRQGAHRYYRLACERGDVESCKREGMPLPEGVVDPDVQKAADARKQRWRDALTELCGPGHAELGPLFDGLVLGGPMPDAMKQRIAAFEKKFQARVRYDPGHPVTQSSWSIDVWFSERTGIEQVLVAGWGKPDLPFGAWTSEEAHVIAYWLRNERESGVSWGPYRSVAELIRPDDADVLGLEPGLVVVGAKLADLQAAMGTRLQPSAEHEHRWTDVGTGPGLEIFVVEKRGVIVELRTRNWSTSWPVVGDQLLAALAQKWGPPKIARDGVHTWSLKGRRVQASKPTSGSFELVIRTR